MLAFKNRLQKNHLLLTVFPSPLDTADPPIQTGKHLKINETVLIKQPIIIGNIKCTNILLGLSYS